MTTARSNQIDLSATPYYHCMTRCVRRSYLCGFDGSTGRDYSHRKPWIVSRIKYLASIFAIHVCAYAVMSNHYHLVLYVNDEMASQWTDKEVQARWAELFPKDAKLLSTYSKKEATYKIALWRHRLMDISWYMRCLNEKIARASNKEDETKGRFWEGRFKSQALLDEGAILSAMAYVDLNPIRAKVAESLENSDFTSIQERLQCLAKQLNNSKSIDNTKQPKHLMPFTNHDLSKQKIPCVEFKLSDYVDLVDKTGRIIREGKRGSIPQNIIPILTRLQLNPNEWLNMVRHLQSRFSYAIGHSAVLLEFNRDCRNYGPKGIQTAQKCFMASSL
ncbi:MAG: transposase [Candidatus Berkiella sp.]